MENAQKQPPAAVDFSEFTPQSYEQWKEEATASLKGAPFDKKLLTKTYEGITLQPLYTAEMAKSALAQSGFPGAGDYLRGAKAGGYSSQPWLIAQEIEASTPAKANAMLREGLAKGAEVICFCPCRCLHKGDKAELKELLAEVDITAYPFQVYAGPEALTLLKNLPGPVKGVIGADPLGSLAQTGWLGCSAEGCYDHLAETIRFAKENMPQLKTIFIQGAVYHEGGANAVQELAAVFASAVAYLDALIERGFSVDEVAGQICFSFALGANFFMEIAKLRAARMIWAQIVKAYGGNEESAKLDLRAATSFFTTTVYDPYVNILRATTQAFSGVVGGVDALTVYPFDAAVRESDEQSRRIARNIQVMLQNEFNLLSPVDPAGGSWYVETLTQQLAEAAWGQLQQIESAGGMLSALKAGSIQQQIAATLAERYKKLASRADRAVGSNMYANMTEVRLKGSEQCCCCCEDEVCGCGCAEKEGIQVTAIEPRRWTEQFEALRIKTEEHAAKSGQNISVFLANMGPIPQHKARADFSAGFFEVGGFTVLRNDGFADVESAAAAAVASKATVAVICSTDDTYPELVPPLAKAIKAQAPKMLVMLAGAPAPEHKDAYVAAGVDEFIHIKANCLQVLSQIQKAGGIE